MSSRDEEKIKEMLKSVRPDYDKAGLWDQIEEKLPQAEKERGAGMWLFLAIGLFFGVVLSYVWVNVMNSDHQVVLRDDSGTETQKVNAVSTDRLLLEESDRTVDMSMNMKSYSLPTIEKIDQATILDAKPVDNSDDFAISLDSQDAAILNQLESKYISRDDKMLIAENQSSAEDDSSFKTSEPFVGITRNLNSNSQETSIMAGGALAVQSRSKESSADVNFLNTSDLDGIDAVEIRRLHSSSLARIDLNYLTTRNAQLGLVINPIIVPSKRNASMKHFLSIQTTNSLFFVDASYTSDSEEWSSTMQEAIRPVWNQGVNISYERSLGAGWYATIGVRAGLFTERLETELERSHEPDVHYSDTAFYYKFDNGIINYYGGETQYQDKELRRIGQYNQSFSIGAQLGLKYIKSWSRWSVAPEVSIYTMPFSFTSGKSITREFDVIERNTIYRGFYGLQGQMALEYRVGSNHHVFAGINYQADLSNRLRSESQVVSGAGLTIGTRIGL